MDTSNVGPGRTFNTVTDAYDAQAGRYADKLPTIPTIEKLPQAQLPMAPMPTPFIIKGGGSGER